MDRCPSFWQRENFGLSCMRKAQACKNVMHGAQQPPHPTLNSLGVLTWEIASKLTGHFPCAHMWTVRQYAWLSTGHCTVSPCSWFAGNVVLEC